MLGAKRLLIAASVLMVAPAVHAEDCLLSGQTPMRVIRLYFGETIAGGGRVTRHDWSAFLRDTVTPRFPDGFTVYDGYGQWMDPKTHRIGSEPSKIVEVAVPVAVDIKDMVASITAAYRRRFQQQSVGVVTMQACAAF